MRDRLAIEAQAAAAGRKITLLARGIESRAEEWPLRDALAAGPAARCENEDDGITGCDVGHACADFRDDARSLVTDHHRQGSRSYAFDRREIRMAEPGSLDLDQHLAGTRSFEIERLDPERTALSVGTRQTLLVKDGTSDLHRSLILPIWLAAR